VQAEKFFQRQYSQYLVAIVEFGGMNAAVKVYSSRGESIPEQAGFGKGIADCTLDTGYHSQEKTHGESLRRFTPVYQCSNERDVRYVWNQTMPSV
jgi:hypothetical protein